jgi:transposase
MEVVAAPSEYPDEVRERERGIRLVRDLVEGGEESITVTGACRRGGQQLRSNTDTLRNWVEPALVCDGERPWLRSCQPRRVDR